MAKQKGDFKMEGNEEKSNLVARTLKRVISKLHDSKIYKKIAGLAIAGAIAFTMAGCEQASLDGSSVTPPDTSIDVDINGGNVDVNEDIDFSKYSIFIQNAYQNENYKDLDKKIEENLEKGFTTDVYSNPYGFWKSRGYDVEAIKSGEIECHTDAYILDEQPYNLYMATYAEDKQNSCYEQYLLRYTLTEQEAKEYNWLHEIRATQSLCLNDIISQEKTPEVLKSSKIDIESYKAMLKDFREKLLIAQGMEYIMQIEKVVDNDIYYVSVIGQWAKPVPVSGPSEEQWGKPSQFSTYMYSNVQLKLHLETSIENGIIKIDTTKFSPEVPCFMISEDDKDNKHISATQYCRQDMTLKAIPQVFKPLEAKLLEDGYLVLDKITESTDVEESK